VLAVVEAFFSSTPKLSKGHYSKPRHLHLILEFFLLLVPVWHMEVKYTWAFICTWNTDLHSFGLGHFGNLSRIILEEINSFIAFKQQSLTKRKKYWCSFILQKMLPSALSSVFQIRVLFFETIFLDFFYLCVGRGWFPWHCHRNGSFSRYFALFSTSSPSLRHKRSIQKYVEYLTGKQKYSSRNVTKEKSRLQGEVED
jgi:hypothetical protein